MKVLACDLGGTKTLLQIAEVNGVSINPLYEQRFDSQTYACLEDMLTEFMQASTHCNQHIHSACIAVAGPIREREATVTNLPWHINVDELTARSGIPHVRLINDFQAVGYGIEGLAKHQTDNNPVGDVITLQTGQPQEHGVRAVIGAGTGLGEGFLIWDTDHYEAMPSEGGHVGFAPADEQQIGLIRFMLNKHRPVTCERLISGIGLVNIFEFICETGNKSITAELEQAIKTGDAAAAISAAALAKTDDAAVAALALFVKIYAAQAGDLALTTLARGGVYIAGGIAPKILDALRQGEFIRTFNDKGKMKDLVSAIPVHVITNAHVGLIGAALVASRL